jgi:hypothetical protein
MHTTDHDPNAPETEADGYRAEAIRRLQVHKLFEKSTPQGKKLAKPSKGYRKKMRREIN